MNLSSAFLALLLTVTPLAFAKDEMSHPFLRSEHRQLQCNKCDYGDLPIVTGFDIVDPLTPNGDALCTLQSGVNDPTVCANVPPDKEVNVRIVYEDNCELLDSCYIRLNAGIPDAPKRGRCERFTPYTLGDPSNTDLADDEANYLQQALTLNHGPNKLQAWCYTEQECGCGMKTPKFESEFCIGCCQNTETGIGQDLGCPADKPICGRDNMELGLGEIGDECFPCLNSDTDGGVDLGCDDDTPLCRKLDGGEVGENQPGEVCSECSLSSQVSVCFALDESGSIGSTNFQTLKTFAGDLVDFFVANSDENEFGVVFFSSSAAIVTDNNPPPPPAYLVDGNTAKNEISSEIYSGGGTNTADAFDKCSLALSDATYNSPLLIMITDGYPNSFSAATTAANNAKNAGNTIITLGIGSYISQGNLDDWASQDGDGNPLSKLVSDFSVLDDFLAFIGSAKVCQG